MPTTTITKRKNSINGTDIGQLSMIQLFGSMYSLILLFFINFIDLDIFYKCFVFVRMLISRYVVEMLTHSSFAISFTDFPLKYED
jgi:hypothetical protein